MTEENALKLYFAFEALLKRALNEVTVVQQRSLLKTTFVNGTAQMAYILKIAPESFLSQLNEMGIDGWAMYAELVRLVQSDVGLNAFFWGAHPRTGEVPPNLFVSVLRFIVTYIDDAQDVRFKRHIFDALCAKLRIEIESVDALWLRKSPLRNFRIPDEPNLIFQLSEDVMIRPISDDERDRWNNINGTPQQLQFHATNASTHLLEIQNHVPKFASPSDPPIAEDDVLFVLRLAGSDAVGIAITEEFLKTVVGGSGAYPNYRLEPERTSEPYELSCDVRVKVKELWHGFLAVRELDRVRFAIRRYNDGWARTVDEDRLVDYWTALESLYSRKNESAEGIRLRVSERISGFLGTGDNYGSLFLAASTSYALRSRVVHGGSSRPIVAADVVTPRMLLKRSLIKVLRHAAVIDLDALDRAIQSHDLRAFATENER